MRFTANCLQRASKCRRGLMKDYWHVDCRQRITVIYEPKIARLAALHRAAKRGEKKLVEERVLAWRFSCPFCAMCGLKCSRYRRKT